MLEKISWQKKWSGHGRTGRTADYGRVLLSCTFIRSMINTWPRRVIQQVVGMWTVEPRDGVGPGDRQLDQRAAEERTCSRQPGVARPGRVASSLERTTDRDVSPAVAMYRPKHRDFSAVSVGASLNESRCNGCGRTKTTQVCVTLRTEPGRCGGPNWLRY